MSVKDKNCKLYVRGFSRKDTKDDVKKAFKKYGRVLDVTLKDGYAFVVGAFLKV